MSTFAVNVVPGYTVQDGEEVTEAILRQIANPTVDVTGSISAASVADGSITTPKLADGAVTNAKLNAAAVATANLQDQSVTTAKIADGAVGTAELADAAVTAAKIPDATITAAKLVAGVLTAPLVGDSRTLVVKPNAGAPNNKLQATADGVILGGSGITFKAVTVNVTGDITASGANGLDTGTEANSTWYYLHVIYNPTGPTVAALLSLSKTAPTLPAGYTYAALVGAVFNNSGGNFTDIITYGNVTRFDSAPVACTLSTPVSIAHNLGAIPNITQWVLVCLNTEAGFAVGDEMECSNLNVLGGLNPIGTDRNATNVIVVPGDGQISVWHKTTAVFTALAYTGTTVTNWKLVCHAILA